MPVSKMGASSPYFVESEAGSGWRPEPDWIDINTVGNNEINILMSDYGIPILAVNVTLSGTCTIDFGDGTILTGCTSGRYEHAYVPGSGQACEKGYTTFFVKIHEATDIITRFYIDRHNSATQNQYPPILWMVLGTQGLTSMASMCGSYTNVSQLLQFVALPVNMNSCASMNNTFSGCEALVGVQMPSSMSNLQLLDGAFSGCTSLKEIILPLTLNAVTTMQQTFYNCYSLERIQMPTSMLGLTNLMFTFSGCHALKSLVLPATINGISGPTQLFKNCYSLRSVTMPTSMPAFTNMSEGFSGCYQLKEINNLHTLGISSSLLNFKDTFLNTELLADPLIFTRKITALTIKGAAGKLNQVSSIRLMNPNSTIIGSSPQIDIAYCSLDATALNALFTDLPTVVGKVIAITGCTGAATCDKTIATLKGWTVTG